MRKAINQHCQNCIYDDSPGNGAWRQQVEKCTSSSCALFDFRPKAAQSTKDKLIPLKSSKSSENELSNEQVEVVAA